MPFLKNSAGFAIKLKAFRSGAKKFPSRLKTSRKIFRMHKEQRFTASSKISKAKIPAEGGLFTGSQLAKVF